MREHPKLNEFEPATYEAWLKLVERDLAGAPFEKRLVKRISGIEIQPLYVRAAAAADASSPPGFAPFTRGSTTLGASEAGWDVRQETAHADAAEAGRAILDDLNGGATSIALVLDRTTREGGAGGHAGAGASAGAEGVALEGLADLEVALAHVPLDKVPVMLTAGASALPVAAGLIALAARRHVAPRALAGALGADPLGTLATAGELSMGLPAALAEAAELAAWTAAHAPRLRALTVDVGPYHDAGADAATELAIALSTGVAYLRALTAAGLSTEAAAKQLVFSFSIGRDFFVELAKLRAARATWAKVVAACGGDDASRAMVLHAGTSRRTKSQRDPWVNLLRGTAETFSAAVGGADAITTASFDAPLGESDGFSRRIARNTQHILRHESNVHRVVDPAGGSWYVEAITDALARRAWAKFQAIEKAGGLGEVLATGALQAELQAMLDDERKAVETRRTSVTGVSEFPNVREEPLERRGSATSAVASSEPRASRIGTFTAGSLVDQARRAVSDGAAFLDVRAALDAFGRAAGGASTRVKPLVRERLAQPFEALRDRADRALAARGKRPTAFLANLGPIPDHKARAAFAQNVLESGGFFVLGNDGFTAPEAAAVAFAESGAELAVLCSSDAVYAELAVSTAQALRAKGAHVIVLAGSPAAAESDYRAAGVTDFVFAGANVVVLLASLLERVERAQAVKGPEGATGKGAR